jgi:hypothetical protein
MRQVREVLRLRTAGVGLNEIARRVGVAPSTVWCAPSAASPSRRPQKADKLTRFGPFSSQCCAENVKIQRSPWNEEPFRVLEGFPISRMTMRSTRAAERWKCSPRN